jgi:hypothetical protein
LAYNHPQEAINVLENIQEKVALLQKQVSEWFSKALQRYLNSTF